MRFFKYLVLIFASIISVNTLSATYYLSQTPNFESSTYQETCRLLAADVQKQMGSSSTYYFLKEASLTSYQNYKFVCNIYKDRYGNQSQHGLYYGFERANTCPAKGWPLPVYLPKGTSRIPIRMCKDGCTVEGSGFSIETNNYTMTTMQFTGDSLNCTNAYKDDPPKCDTKDPYGDCFVPPKDDCVRGKDGSITCPDNSVPPPKNNTCNGATYCKRPPEGCGEGYVSGSFNGEQLCVRSGPNTPKNPPDPDKPDDPKNCMNGGTYCPQPPDNTTCPDGYSETTFNGSKICVKDNPDPDKPNPNDPNNPDYGGGGDNGSGGSEPTDGGDGSTGGSVNLKPVIDAINALKNSLLSALSGISAKMDKLINGQTETNKKLDTSNDHLKNIKDESVKTNEKLDTSNGHLEKIEEATKATSEAVGESNKKLDGVKDAVEGMYKCKNEAYNPNDKSSSKYRECTEQDAKNAFGEEPKMPFKDLDPGSINTGLFKITGQCPAPYQLHLPVVNHTFPIDISQLCDVLAIIGYFIALAAMIHGIAILVENS